MRNQKGITLIALVITIIVLLILAGVSIAMLTGENGILNRATTAQQKTTKAEAEEALKMTISEILSNKLDPTYEATGTDESIINATNIETMIQDINSNVTADATDKTTGTGEELKITEVEVTLTISGDDYSYTVNANTGEFLEKDENNAAGETIVGGDDTTQ